MKTDRTNAGPNLKHLIVAACACMISSMLISSEAMAALSGSGSSSDPITGTAAVNDKITAGKYVENLTTKDGARITAKRIYTAKNYNITFNAGSGRFTNGSAEIKTSASFGDDLYALTNKTVTAEPTLSGKKFVGWYFKGNHKQGQASSLVAYTEGSPGDTIIKSGVRLLAAADDATDKTTMNIDGSGNVVISAIWRSGRIAPNDGNEPDDKTAENATAGLDAWDASNAANHVIEYLSKCPTKQSYAESHGRTKYQYGRILLNAETTQASLYDWQIKRAGDADYKSLGVSTSSLRLDNISKTDNGAYVRCVVKVGTDALGNTAAAANTNGGGVVYQTRLTVYTLPSANAISVKVNGTALSSIPTVSSIESAVQGT